MSLNFENVVIPKLKEGSKERILNLKVEKSVFFVLPPSEGKTYLFEHIIGLRKNFSGKIKIQNILVDLELEGEFFEARKRMGIIFEKPVLLSNLSVEENLKLILKSSSQNLSLQETINRVSTYLKRFHLEEFIAKRPSELTQNQLKVISFIMGVIHKPEILIWDEPKSDFPPNILEEIHNELNQVEIRKGIFLGLTSTEKLATEFKLKSVVL